jgi:adenylate kinase
MQIIIFGSPGVGKGTQAKIIATKYNIPHISTGDILREAINVQSELGNKAKEIVERGELVPDDIMGEIIKDTLHNEKCKNGFILDGYPRTVAQAQILDNILNNLNQNKTHLIKLDADDEVIVKRLSNRLVCKKCGNIIINNELMENSKCKVCGSLDSFIKRKDDDEEVIRRRLKVYNETTAQVLNYYKDKLHIIEIDGTLPIEQVTEQIITQLQMN